MVANGHSAPQDRDLRSLLMSLQQSANPPAAASLAHPAYPTDSSSLHPYQHLLAQLLGQNSHQSFDFSAPRGTRVASPAAAPPDLLSDPLAQLMATLPSATAGEAGLYQPQVLPSSESVSQLAAVTPHIFGAARVPAEGSHMRRHEPVPSATLKELMGLGEVTPPSAVPANSTMSPSSAVWDRFKSRMPSDGPIRNPIQQALGDLYSSGESGRRQDPFYRHLASELYDINIVLPISIPYGEVVIDTVSGQNFYEFGKGHAGAQLLFGRPQSDVQETVAGAAQNVSVASTGCHTPGEDYDGNAASAKAENLQRNSTSESSTLDVSSGAEGASAEDAGGKAPSADPATPNHKSATDSTPKADAEQGTPSKNQNHDPGRGAGPVCDVWASFLHVKLGTIYNVPAHLIPVVTDTFSRAFDSESCVFFVPITLDCKGVFPCEEATPARYSNRLQYRGITRSCSYETRGGLVTDNDRARFRMLRRYLKKFARDLVLLTASTEHQMSPSTEFRPGLPGGFETPKIRVELDENCRSLSLFGGIKVVVREFSPLHAEMKEFLARSLRSKNNLAAGLARLELDEKDKAALKSMDLADDSSRLDLHTIMDWSARVMLGEIRLEHTRLRQVDPRWHDQIVMGRRIVDTTTSEIPEALDFRARFVFCSRIKQPKIRYAVPPSRRYIRNKLHAILSAHMNEFPKSRCAFAALIGESSDNTTDLSSPAKVFADDAHTDAEQIGERSNRASSYLDESSSVKALTGNSASKKMAPAARKGSSKPTCRYFSVSGCVRGDSCLYLHPADPQFESRVDVREVRDAQNPKFF